MAMVKKRARRRRNVRRRESGQGTTGDEQVGVELGWAKRVER